MSCRAASSFGSSHRQPRNSSTDSAGPAGQMIFSGSGTPADAAELWERVAQTWRSAHPDELANWQKLAQ